MNYYEHHLGDYLKKTAHLTMAEEGAYRRLLDRYYTTERPLPADIRECCKLARAVSKPDRDAVKAVLQEFFTLDAEGYHQRRADEEIARFKGKQAKAKASADARWGAQRTHSERNANASAEHDAQDMRTHSERNANGMHRAPVPSPQSPDPIPSDADASAAALPAAPAPMSPKDRLWALGVALLGEKGRGKLGKLVATHTEAVVLDALQAAAREQPGDPYPWLVSACEARSNGAGASNGKGRSNGAEQADLLADPRPQWAINAGFPNRFEAENAGCLAHNASKFRNGRRIAAHDH